MCVPTRDNGAAQDRLDHRRRFVAAVDAEDELKRAGEKTTERRSFKFDWTSVVQLKPLNSYLPMENRLKASSPTGC